MSNDVLKTSNNHLIILKRAAAIALIAAIQLCHKALDQLGDINA